MNVLLLSNSAPNYFHFFNALAKCFEQAGATVVVAVDSTFSREENGLDALGFSVYDFSCYFREHETNQSILSKYAEFDLNGALLSDFERAEIYGVWGQGVSIEYYDKLKSALLSYFEDIFLRHQINMVLYENVSNAFAHLALYVAKKHGAVYCGIGGSRLPGRFSVTGDPLADDATKKAFTDIQSGHLKIADDVRQWAADYIAAIETIVPDYMKVNGLDRVSLVKRYLRADRLRKIVSLIRHIADRRLDAFQVGNPLLTHANLFYRNVQRRLKISKVKKLYQEPVHGETFLLYPMHFHPESSTSILSGAYLDEYEVIRNIAFSLPEGVRLYVKDHISAWGYPTLDFYRRICRLPNVRLLRPDAPTKKIIKDAAGVITLTSTVGYEALLLKKRVFLYGCVFYDFHKGVTKIENPAKLHALLRREMLREVDWDDNYNIDFVCAYHEATLPVSLNLMQSADLAVENARKVFQVLPGFIGE